MTAPTSPGVVPADDVRELVDELRAQRIPHHIGPFTSQFVPNPLCVRAADMLERLANRPSLTEDEREQVRREALEEAARSAQAWRVIPEDFIVPGAMSAEELVIARRTAKGIEDHLRALADRAEPRQEKEGKA